MDNDTTEPLFDFIFNLGYGRVWHIVENVQHQTFPLYDQEEDAYGGDAWRRIKPAHRVWRGRAICNQVGMLEAGGLDWGTWKNFNKGERTLTYKPKKVLYRHTDTDIPEPLCTACARKAGLL